MEIAQVTQHEAGQVCLSAVADCVISAGPNYSKVWHFFCASAALSSSSFFTAAFSALAGLGHRGEVRVNAPTLELPREWALAMLRKDGMALKLLPQFCNDRECVEAAVSQTCFALSFASIELRADKELARSAIQHFASKVCTDSLNLEPCMGEPEHVSSSTDALPFLSSMSKEIRSDKELMLKVVQWDGRQLCVVEPVLLKDPEVVYAAVSKHPMALRYVAEHERESSADQGYAKSKSSASRIVEQRGDGRIRGLGTGGE
eukprot:s226_g29.t1